MASCDMEMILDNLCCPCDKKSALYMRDGRLFCANNSCVNSAQPFHVSCGQHVIVPFHKDTILTLQQYEKDAQCDESDTYRFQFFTLFKRKITSLSNGVTQSNINKLLGYIPANPKILIIGGGKIGRGIERLYDHPGAIISSFDIRPTKNTDLVADAHYCPYKDELFDVVIVQAVLEHVLNPEIVVSEIWRVLKNTGHVYSEIPFLQGVHEGAYDFTRFTLSGHIWLYNKFTPVVYGVNGGPLSSLTWSLRGVLKVIVGHKISGLIVFPLKLLSILIERLGFFNSSDYCLGSYYLAKKDVKKVELRANQIVSYYKR